MRVWVATAILICLVVLAVLFFAWELLTPDCVGEHGAHCSTGGVLRLGAI